MIGSAAARSLIATLVLGALLALRPASAAAADPPGERAREAAIDSAAGVTATQVDELSAVLEVARDAARRGSALVVSGAQDPAPELLAAAAALEEGATVATRAQAAMTALSGVFAAVRPRDAPPALAVSAPTLLGIASQLRGSADAGRAFVERRHASEATLSAMGEALAAMERGDVDAAETALGAARDAQAVVGAWDAQPPELSIWLATTSAMLDAADRIVAAVRSGDAAAADAAGADYREAAGRAALADRALALAISEGGAAVTATPLVRLAGALQEVAAARAALEELASR